jgi:hypothetical protein
MGRVGTFAAAVSSKRPAVWDVSFAIDKREVTPLEQHVHSFLEMLPLMGTLIVAILHWPQFLALFGAGPEAARFNLAMKPEPLPWSYVTSFLLAVLLFEVLPYLEELVRGLRASASSRPEERSTFRPH